MVKAAIYVFGSRFVRIDAYSFDDFGARRGPEGPLGEALRNPGRGLKHRFRLRAVFGSPKARPSRFWDEFGLKKSSRGATQEAPREIPREISPVICDGFEHFSKTRLRGRYRVNFAGAENNANSSFF